MQFPLLNHYLWKLFNDACEVFQVWISNIFLLQAGLSQSCRFFFDIHPKLFNYSSKKIPNNIWSCIVYFK